MWENSELQDNRQKAKEDQTETKAECLPWIPRAPTNCDGDAYKNGKAHRLQQKVSETFERILDIGPDVLIIAKKPPVGQNDEEEKYPISALLLLLSPRIKPFANLRCSQNTTPTRHGFMHTAVDRSGTL